MISVLSPAPTGATMAATAAEPDTAPATTPNPSTLTAKTLADVREQVERDDEGKWDSIARCQTLTLHQGRLVFPEASEQGYDSGLALTPWATSQACQQLGLPAAYFKRCPAFLKDQNFNYWQRFYDVGHQLGKADQEPDAAWMLRCKGGAVRGILSPRYAKLDNRQLLDALFPLLSSTRYHVSLAQLTPESFHLRLIDSTIARDVLPGDRLFVGIHVANSEVGLRAVTVDALVFRLICTNGLIRRVNEKSLLRQRHIHVADARFRELLERAIREAVTVAAGFIEQMALAVKTPVPDPEQAILMLGQAWNLPQSTQELIRFALLGEPRTSEQESLYGLTNALTSAAQRLGIEERFTLETLAGLLIDTTSPSAAAHSLRTRLLSASK
jgi:hypothetical protein